MHASAMNNNFKGDPVKKGGSLFASKALSLIHDEQKCHTRACIHAKTRASMVGGRRAALDLIFYSVDKVRFGSSFAIFFH